MIDLIQHEHDFKVTCDGLLRFELGQLVQTYASRGADTGIDAEFVGAIDGVTGRWVFQYKFRSPSEALSARRTWLARRFVGTKSEFDKDGVKGADGYILVTNVPVTVSMVRKLTTAWRKARRGKAPLCVWDPSRLNVMLKGREHLARSWNGQKEARCQQVIVLPAWQWLQSTLAVAANWVNDPLWPLRVESYQWPEPLGAFHNNFAWKYGMRIVPRDAALRSIQADPQFSYAFTIAFPRALELLTAVRQAVDALAQAVLREIDALRDSIVSRLPQLEQLEAERRPEVARVLAYCVLENRWGFAMRGLHYFTEGQLVVNAQFLAWQGTRLDIEGRLDDLVREAPHGNVPEGVVARRAKLAALLQEWWSRLWYVVELGIDAEG